MKRLPESTIIALEQRYGELFRQLADIFDDRTAGSLVWQVIGRRWPGPAALHEIELRR